ncbi:MAG TPA: EVE domain-containing protein [Nitrososphaera sp.]|nr:EVE domain-containing protein [Nitrososphaera sp.]
MAYWLFKQEPSAYSYSQLEKDGRTVWDGVTNYLALKYLKSVKNGDRAFFYHTGAEKQVVGIMEIMSDPYPDPNNKSLTVVDVRPIVRLGKPVTLDAIKKDPAFSSWELVRIPRLSVMPVPDKLWDRIVRMSKQR